MKLSLKSCINTTSPVFSLFEENKYAYPIGRNLCIKTLAENIYQFIPLNERYRLKLTVAWSRYSTWLPLATERI